MAVVKPDISARADVNQIYPIVNDVFKQMTGREDIQAVDTNSLVDMGQTIEALGKQELWLDTLARRISRTIDTYRPYHNKFSELNRTQIEMGAIVQKISVNMPEAVSDEMWNVGKMDGQSIDQWIISNPKVSQKFYDKEAPYSYFITIQQKLLNRAFTSASAMQAFITQIFGKVTNKREFIHEELGRMALANLVLNLKDTQEIKLVTIYNNAYGATLTTQTALHDDEFLRWSNAFINKVSRSLTTMNTLYNQADDGFNDKFTDEKDQRLYLHSEYKTALEVIPDYLAFAHPVMKESASVPYWQANAHVDDADYWDTVTSVKGTNKEGTETEATNLIAILFDKDCVGTYRHEESVYTTPMNARGVYYNTFWHENNFWFNDLDENAVAFYLE